MKKLLALLLAVLLLPTAAMAGTVVTSFYPILVIALNLLDGIEGIEVHSLAGPGVGCLHDYQLTTSDMKALAKADVFLINGAGMEGYLDFALENLPDLPVADASVGIELIEDEDEEGEGNPHVWLDAGNMMIMVSNLADGLIEHDPQHADAIAANRDAYLARLQVLDSELREGLRDVPQKNIVTFHEAFPYFAKAYGLNVAAVMTLEPEDALSARALVDLIRTVDALDDPPLFTEPQYESMAAITVANETGAPLYELDPAVTGPEDQIPLTFYEDCMRRNLAVLRQALGAE